MINESEKIKSDALIAFKEKRFDDALRLFQALTNNDDPQALFCCGMILERGWSSRGKDYPKAYGYFKKLAIDHSLDEGYFGCVRYFLRTKCVDQKDKAVDFCMMGAKGGKKYVAYLLLGMVYEELFPLTYYSLAKKYYLESIFHGSAWAMRKYAFLLNKSGNKVGSFLMHILATILSPIFVIFGGFNTTRTYY